MVHIASRDAIEDKARYVLSGAWSLTRALNPIRTVLSAIWTLAICCLPIFPVWWVERLLVFCYFWHFVVCSLFLFPLLGLWNYLQMLKPDDISLELWFGFSGVISNYIFNIQWFIEDVFKLVYCVEFILIFYLSILVEDKAAPNPCAAKVHEICSKLFLGLLTQNDHICEDAIAWFNCYSKTATEQNCDSTILKKYETFVNTVGRQLFTVALSADSCKEEL